MANLHPHHSPYSVQLRERVVYKRVVEHQSYAQISEGFGGNPSIETVVPGLPLCYTVRLEG